MSFGKTIKGYDNGFVPLTGIETRTSAPVRILRQDDFTAPGHNNIYPCGEGAGYAGGITSAATDGIKTAEKIIENLKVYLTSDEMQIFKNCYICNALWQHIVFY